MRILAAGDRGYLGAVMIPFLRRAGHEVVGLDAGWYDRCDFGPVSNGYEQRTGDIRDVGPGDLTGFDAVVNLAALSNDPVGHLDPRATYSINTDGAVHLGAAAKAAGVPRYLFASSCSLYGAGGDGRLTEDAELHPVTPYGRSKVMAEEGLSALADDSFSPTYLRNATAYGLSPRLRGDLVVNNLVGYAVSIGEVRMKSDGMPWRPLVHIEDIARAFLAIAEAPRDLVHLKAYNVGRTEENYRIREVAEIVERTVPGSRVTFGEGAGPDKRNYRVDCSRIVEDLPAYQPVWTVADGAAEVLGAFEEDGLTLDELNSSRFQRIKCVLGKQEAGLLGDDLRPTPVAVEVAHV